MNTRTVTILAIVVALLVISGTALAIGSQFVSPTSATAQAANSPEVSDQATTSTVPYSGLVTLDTSETGEVLNLEVPGLPTTVIPSTSTTTETTETTAPLTTTTSAPPTTTTTTTTPATTTTTPATTTTTAPATTTTTVPPTTTTTVPPTSTTTTAPSGGSFSASKEAQFVSLINGVRADVGVPALTVSGSLNSYARDWTFYMSDTNTFEHSDIGSLLGPWSTVGENIAYGWGVTSMHNALVASPGHYANLTSPNFTHVGVGVWVEEGGKIWTTHVFGG